MKKVLILANNSVGLYNFRKELIEKLIEESYDVHFSLPESKEDQKVQLLMKMGAKHHQTEIDRRGMNPFKDIQLILHYISLIKKVKPDIILTYTIKPNIYGTCVASMFNIPVIMNVTGIGTALTKSRFKNLFAKLYKMACTKASVVFFQNEHNLDLFVNNNLVSVGKTRLIPGSGVNVHKFYPVAKEKASDKPIKFLFIGRLMEEKGITEYINAAIHITSKYDNVEFQILGPFEELKVKQKIEGINHTRIKYLGVSNDVRIEISSVDCVVNPSYHEGMSNVLLEAAAMGKPLIASNIPGCKEIIEDKKNGFLFEVKSVDSLIDKIEHFLRLDSHHRQEMGCYSRKKVEQEFDRNKIVDTYLSEINYHLNRGGLQ